MNNSRRLISATALVGATVLALPALAACSGSGSAAADAGNGGGKLKVTASFYPMEFLVARIGGDHVAITDLTEPGIEPHDLELAPKQIAALGEADVVVYLRGLQPAVDDAIKQSGAKTVVDATELTALRDHGTEVDGRHGTTQDNGTGAEEAEDAGSDPHVWLDPVKYAEVAKGVGRSLEQADPDNAATYAKNTNALVARLGALDGEFRNGLKNRSSDTFVTTHAAFGYLAERYGLVEEAINGIDPESEPSGARMKTLQDLAEDNHVTTVFFETLVSDKTARTLAGDLGVKTGVLDPVEGITPRSGGTDYFGVQRSNLQALRSALGTK
jgi:zinc transport system substrate-binding protein